MAPDRQYVLVEVAKLCILVSGTCFAHLSASVAY